MRKLKLHGWINKTEEVYIPENAVIAIIYCVTGDQYVEFYQEETMYGGGSIEYLTTIDPFRENRRKDCIDAMYCLYLQMDDDEKWNKGEKEKLSKWKFSYI